MHHECRIREGDAQLGQRLGPFMAAVRHRHEVPDGEVAAGVGGVGGDVVPVAVDVDLDVDAQFLEPDLGVAGAGLGGNHAFLERGHHLRRHGLSPRLGEGGLELGGVRTGLGQRRLRGREPGGGLAVGGGRRSVPRLRFELGVELPVGTPLTLQLVAQAERVRVVGHRLRRDGAGRLDEVHDPKP